MPHLMNCPHRGNSHCLDCVKRAWEESDQRIRDLEAALEAATDAARSSTK